MLTTEQTTFLDSYIGGFIKGLKDVKKSDFKNEWDERFDNLVKETRAILKNRAEKLLMEHDLKAEESVAGINLELKVSPEVEQQIIEILTELAQEAELQTRAEIRKYIHDLFLDFSKKEGGGKYPQY